MTLERNQFRNESRISRRAEKTPGAAALLEPIPPDPADCILLYYFFMKQSTRTKFPGGRLEGEGRARKILLVSLSSNEVNLTEDKSESGSGSGISRTFVSGFDVGYYDAHVKSNDPI